MSEPKASPSFKERYEGDEAFRKRVDASRSKAAAQRGTQALEEALKMARGDRTARKKFY